MQAPPTPTHNMKYRFLGDSGLLVSTFSLGTAGFGTRLDSKAAYSLVEHAFKNGINFFDSAEDYGSGKAEVVLGEAIKTGIERGVWTREDLVVSTKIFLGTGATANFIGLSRKHIIEGAKASLKRLDFDYVDLIFCHRPDPRTPIEETVRAMNWVIQQGLAFYWGTSEWHANDIIEACEIADRLGLARPVMDQPQYHILERSRVDYEFAPLYEKYTYGLTTWSPLDSGILTGKYKDGIPEGSRLSTPGYGALRTEEKVAKVAELDDIAKELDCSLAQLAIAWCATNKNVSSVILGATSVAQLDENLKAATVVGKITSEIKDKVDKVVQFEPKTLPRHEDSVIHVRSRWL